MSFRLGPANERLNEPTLDAGDELVICPYNPSHRLRPQRYHLHLKKCAAQNTDKKFVICRLNFTHHVPEDQIEEHMRTCPDRHKVDSFIYTSAENPMKHVPIAIPIDAPEESWDDDDHPTYDPLKANENNPVLLCLKGASRSERKHFQTQQRIRNSRLLNGEPPLS